jgi:hypothetical protein
MALPAQRKNFATNPSFEAATDFTLRTNLCPNPSFETDTTGTLTNYGTSGTGVISRPATGAWVGTYHTRMTWSTASTVIGGYFQNDTGALGVGAYTYSLYVRSSVTQRVQLLMSNYSGALSVTSNPAVDLLANTWTRITCTFNVTTAGSFTGRASAVAGGSGKNWAVGNTFDTDGWLLETGTLLRPFFDGNTADDADFTYGWNGTINKSISTVTARTVTGYQSWWAGAEWDVYQTAAQFRTGTSAMRAVAKTPATFLWGTSSTNGFPCAEGEPVTASYYVRPSVTRTFTATVSWNVAQPNLTSPMVSCPANVWTRITVSGTVPPGATLGTVYFNTETVSTAGDTYDFDSLLIEKVAALDTYFDGDTEEAGWSHLWQGLDNASASTRDATGLWVDVELEGTARTILTVLGLGLAQSVTKIVRTDGKSTWPVPGWGRRLTVDADTGTDWTVPLGRPVTYTLFKDGVAIASRTVTVNAATGDIMDPLDPPGALKVNTTDLDPNVLTLSNLAITKIIHANTASDREYPLGARYPIARPGVRSAAQQVPLVFNAARNQASDALLDMVQDAPILLVRALPSWGSVPALIYTDAPVEEVPLNRGRGGQFTQWSLEADAVAPVTRASAAGRVTNAEVQAALTGRTHDSIQAASGTKRHVEIKANPLSLGQ